MASGRLVGGSPTVATAPASKGYVDALLIGGPLTGFGPANLPNWRRALARVLTGGGDAKLLCIGDSTTAGYGSNGSGAIGTTPSYPSVLATRMNSSIPAAKGLGIYAANSDSRWTLGSNWAQGGLAWGASGTAHASGSSIGSLVYADPGAIADRFDIYFLGYNGSFPFTAQATGGTATAVTDPDTGTGGVYKVTISASSASVNNTVTITRPSGTGDVYIAGIEPWLSTTSKIRVANAGSGGSRAVDWATSSQGVFQSIAAIKRYAPDLAIISLGINDAISGNPVGSTASTPAAVASAVQAVASACKNSGDVIIVPPLLSSPSGTSASVIATERAYAAALMPLGYPYADAQARQGDGDAMSTLGMEWDALHRNALGYADLAQMLAPALLAI